MRSIEFYSDLDVEARRVFNLRELLRGNKHQSMPSGADGLIIEDWDLIIRWYGPQFGLDGWGRFRYVELKRYGSDISTAQRYTFGMPHAFCSERPDRYDGFYVVCHSDDEHNDDTSYRVNGQPMTCAQFLEWVLTPYSPIPPRRYFEIPRMNGATP